ncbi:uncharacterized protein BO80DRAFT_426528 [Aspergillus ibericus CBS 121593]|uniref:Uncharacterized protein n=1 Tax=Aspergillus ibericus CBS 121593 TaxID=1448316 RepID=A0A395GXX9_9EURO|nr:hypothetical protein BO80DRAFT_426528 [Aspergillus ibericus CBS 121593]RAK99547.1 hypothetical protein BO80DRAFT_426528 [Aspergillus ibericus CBS 121593]
MGSGRAGLEEIYKLWKGLAGACFTAYYCYYYYYYYYYTLLHPTTPYYYLRTLSFTCLPTFRHIYT